jgi:hypothetical protein
VPARIPRRLPPGGGVSGLLKLSGSQWCGPRGRGRAKATRAPLGHMGSHEPPYLPPPPPAPSSFHCSTFTTLWPATQQHHSTTAHTHTMLARVYLVALLAAAGAGIAQAAVGGSASGPTNTWLSEWRPWPALGVRRWTQAPAPAAPPEPACEHPMLLRCQRGGCRPPVLLPARRPLRREEATLLPRPLGAVSALPGHPVQAWHCTPPRPQPPPRRTPGRGMGRDAQRVPAPGFSRAAPARPPRACSLPHAGTPPRAVEHQPVPGPQRLRLCARTRVQPDRCVLRVLASEEAPPPRAPLPGSTGPRTSPLPCHSMPLHLPCAPWLPGLASPRQARTMHPPGRPPAPAQAPPPRCPHPRPLPPAPSCARSPC